MKLTREDVSTSMGRASANPTQVLWYNKSGIFNRLVPCSDNISQLSCSSYTKLLNSYDCAYYVPIVSGCLSWDSLANLSLWLLLNLINLTPRCSSVFDEKLSLCLERFLWSLVCLCSCISAALLSWSLFVRFLNLLFRLQFQLLDELAPFLFYVGVFFLSQLKTPYWFS